MKKLLIIIVLLISTIRSSAQMTTLKYYDGLTAVENALGLSSGVMNTSDRQSYCASQGCSVGLLNAWLHKSCLPISIVDMYYCHLGKKLPLFTSAYSANILDTNAYAVMILVRDSLTSNIKFKGGKLRKGNLITLSGDVERGLFRENYLHHEVYGMFMFIRDSSAAYITHVDTADYIPPVPVFVNGSWTGFVSTDWNNAGNWVGGVPDSTKSITIPYGTTYAPTVNIGGTSKASCYNMTIDHGAILTIDTGKHLSVYGTITNNNSTDGILIKANATQNGTLIYNTGTVDATVQMYLASGVNYISSPIASAPITLFAPDTLWQWNEPDTAFEPINVALMDTMRGYRVSVSTNKTISFKGKLNTGVIGTEKNLLAMVDRWNLIGNPYPCYFEFTGTGWTKTNIDPQDTLYTPMTYVSQTTRIAPCKAVLVRCGGSELFGTLIFGNATKRHY